MWEIENEKRENRTNRIVKRMRTIVGMNKGAISTLLVLSSGYKSLNLFEVSPKLFSNHSPSHNSFCIESFVSEILVVCPNDDLLS